MRIPLHVMCTASTCSLLHSFLLFFDQPGTDCHRSHLAHAGTRINYYYY